MAVAALLLMAVAPLALSAAPAIRNFSMDRASVTSGQNITFTVETTADTQFVFAMADGVRTQGSRSTGNSWTVTVAPTASTSVTIFANTANNESGAARVSVPVVVTGTTAPTPAQPTPPSVSIPPAPSTLGPIAIASVTETPATAAGNVQLTVVTGRETNEVWVNFDRVNNQRGTGRFSRGTMQSQGAHYRVWVINFRPAQWATQRVEVGSNRTYNWPGASTQMVDLSLTQPYVRATNPSIQNVTTSTRTVATGANVTFTIRTNADVENVWVRNVDGTEFNATRSASSGTTRNWSVTFNPVRSGSVTVFANNARTEEGAARRTESITVGAVNAQIIGTPTASFIDGGNNRFRVTATTNEAANSVWIVMPWTNERRYLARTDSGSGNRTWTVDVWDANWFHHQDHHFHTQSLTVHASSGTGTGVSSQDSRTITTSGWGWGGSGSGIQSITPSAVQSVPSAGGGTRQFTVQVWGVVGSGTGLWASSNIAGISASVSAGHDIGGGLRSYVVNVIVAPGTPVGNHTIWLNTHHGHHQNITINVTN